MPDLPTRREHDLEIALRLQKLEIGMLELQQSLAKNTLATTDLLLAWNSSKWFLGLVKVGAATVVGLAAGWAVLSKWWGH